MFSDMILSLTDMKSIFCNNLSLTTYLVSKMIRFRKSLRSLRSSIILSILVEISLCYFSAIYFEIYFNNSSFGSYVNCILFDNLFSDLAFCNRFSKNGKGIQLFLELLERVLAYSEASLRPESARFGWSQCSGTTFLPLKYGSGLFL